MEKRRIISFMAIAFLALSIGLTSCSEDDPDPNPDPDPTEKEFVGSESCKICHTDKYTDWEDSGHPYKFTITDGSLGPVYPTEAHNFQSNWLTGLTDGSATWDNIAGVIGGYGWKARFVGTDGDIIGTLESEVNAGYGVNQFNFYGGVDHGWVDYHKTDKKTYNYSCFKCHTTGGTQEGTWLAGVDGLGNFTEGGVGCESCHGPGSKHIDDPLAEGSIDRVYEFAHLDNSSGGLEIDGTVQTPNEFGDDVNFLCGTCHNRGYTNVIDSKGGFIKHHEQWDEFTTTAHMTKGKTCSTCHDPHKRVIWEGNGIIAECGACHSDKVAVTNHGPGATCIDCHMPFASKSGTTRGESGFEGDVRSHLMKITVKDESMFTTDSSAVRNDANRPASLSLEYSCLGCHNRSNSDGAANKTLQQALDAAAGMHATK